MFPLLAFCSFTLGLCAGSFLNVYVYRLKEGVEGLLDGRSFCPRCKTPLAAIDLIPILSFVLLKGRCRYCRKKISWRYPIVELLCGIAFLLLFLTNPLSDPIMLALLFGIVFLLLTLSVYDAQTLEVPMVVVRIGMIVSAMLVIYRIWTAGNIFPLTNAYTSALIAFIFFGSQTFLSRERWMGRGDLYVGLLIALILTWQEFLLALFIAYVSGAIVGIVILVKKGKSKKKKLPLVPFLVAGALMALFWGPDILGWYLGLLGG